MIENGLQKIINRFLETLCTTDAEGRFLTISTAAAHLWGYTPHELLGMSYCEVMYADDKEVGEQKLAEIKSQTQTITFTNRCIHKNGWLIYIIWSGFWDNDEQRFYLTVKEAEQQRPEEFAPYQKELNTLFSPERNNKQPDTNTKSAERKAEYHHLKLLESVITNTTDAVIITEAEPIDDVGPRILYVNAAFTHMTGYTREDVLGKTPRILQGPKTDRRELDRMRHALETWQPCEITVINYKKTGEEFWIHMAVNPVADENGWYTHWVSIERDVTQQKNEELRKRLLVEISQLFNRNETLIPTLQTVLEHLAAFAGFNLAEAWLISSDQKQINLIATYSKDEAARKFYKESENIKSFPFGNGLPGTVWKNHKVELWGQLHSKDDFIRKTAAEISGTTAVMGIPLTHNEKVLGVLVFGTCQPAAQLTYFEELFKELEFFLGTELRRKLIEDELNHIFNSTPGIICLSSFDGYFKRMSPAACRLLEYSEEELLAQPFLHFIHPDDYHKTTHEVAHLQQGQTTFHFENRFITKTGKVKWLAWTATKSAEEDLMFGIAKDITEQKNLQLLLDTASELAKIGSWELDLIHHSIYWSKVVRDIHETGKDFIPDFINGLHFYREDVRETVLKIIRECIKNRTPFDFEMPIITAKGNERWIRTIGQGEYKDEKCVRLYGSFQDIHLRKMAELELQQAYAEKNSILESIQDGFLTVNKEWAVTYWNRKAETILGTNREGIIGQKLWDTNKVFITPELYAHLHKAADTGAASSFETYFPELENWFEISIYPSETGLSAYFKDISNRKKAEEEFRQSNERFQKVTAATQDAIWDWDIENDSLYWGEGFKTLFGYSIESSDPTLHSWRDRIHPEDLEEITQALANLFADPSINKCQQEYRYRKATGEYAFVIDRYAIIRNKDGKPIRMIGAMTDITYRKEAEEALKRLNETLNVRAKELALSNAELEQFAYVASHDLQEPLRMVTGFLTQLDKKYGDSLDAKAKQYIAFAVDGAKRMRQIILDLLDFSRVGKTVNTIEDVSIKALTDEVCQLQSTLIEESKAVFHCHHLPTIRTYRAPLFQVFQNLIGNALKYRKEGIPPEIVIQATENPAEWLFSIRDNGIGIREEYFEKIFVIFQRLHNKEKYSGTGIGLSIVKKIIENLGGRIWLESEPDRGSTFYFTIPK
ncbi:PAS domain S-box protein [Runella slithyformis]|uniref:histidine kinase n=1 Tax=Runella slithyformis (strain ATCC 29530 / DSM 19594 / LMG 11500 / NCIMB 11436 / LSU 4) TaxID=761193 RepID=A0A7U4E4T7_RUNSL|nr:PAS domain S-box protein [Runella slithyformis]AEI47414.1 multi-sensor signal transduction histidine kinase [Runella slithyformis DSM 19594]